MDPRPLLLLCLLAAAPGCRADAAGAPISRDRFVAANVALRTLPPDATEEQRAAVLARYRVTADDLHGWVRAHADRPEVLAEAWQRVAGRLDSLSAELPPPENDGVDVDGAPPPPGAIVEEPIPGVIKESPHVLPGHLRALERPDTGRPEPRRRPPPPPEEAGQPEPLVVQ